MGILNRNDLQTARALFARACANSRMHESLARDALATYGDHGPEVSGCVRQHFPSYVQAELRALATEVRLCSQEAHAARPRGVRRATMVKLSRAVAARDGSGFYGPQP
jgi:hypothetical protein